jgi:hypothetical protein
MNIPRYILLGSLAAAFVYPSELCAKRVPSTATPTFTLTAMPTDTPTFTPTPMSRSFKKIYTFDTLWGSKGSELSQVNDPEWIAVSPDGRIFIADTANNRILVWDKDGKPIKAYGTFGTRADWRNPPQFNHPAGVFVYPSNQIYVADTLNNRIVVLDEHGLVISTWGTQGSGNSQFNLPRGLCEDHFWNIWVLDSGNSRVQIFSNMGVFNSAWGSFGAQAEAKANTRTAIMNVPLGLGLNSIDQAIVGDTGNSLMEVSNNGGVPVTVLGWYGDNGPYEFKEPSGVVITQSGIAAIADGISGRVVFYNSRNGDFEFLGEWRAKDEILNANYAPRFRGIACDPEDRLYVTDIQNNAIIRLVPVKAASDQTTPLSFKPTPTPADASPYGGAGFPIR